MVTITISGAEKSGGLARITAFFMRKGYPLKSHQVVESPSGAKLVKISLDITQLDKIKLAAEIKSLSPDFMVVSVEGSQSGSAPSIKEIAARFPDIAPLVQAYGESFGADTRDRELAEAGKKSAPFNTKRNGRSAVRSRCPSRCGGRWFPLWRPSARWTRPTPSLPCPTARFAARARSLAVNS